MLALCGRWTAAYFAAISIIVIRKPMRTSTISQPEPP
jgi:hypothetical protein